MPDYQKMYHLLFREMTDVIERLQLAQQRAEELYMDAPEPLRLPPAEGTPPEQP